MHFHQVEVYQGQSDQGGIITGTALESKRNPKAEFGEYCQTHKDNVPPNTMVIHKKGEMRPMPSNNRQGRYNFLCLDPFPAGF